IRMATELQFVNQPTEAFQSAVYDFHNNFLAAFLYVSPKDYDERTLWFADLMFLMTLCLFLPGIFLVLFRGRRTEIETVKAAITTICVAIFFATPLSNPIWEHFVALQQTQFPWRWLAVISLMGCFLVARAGERIAEAFKSNFRPVAILAVGLMIACAVFTATQVIKPSVYTNRQEFTQRIDSLSHAKSYECWWPVWAREEAFKDLARATAENRWVEVVRWQPTHRSLTVSSGEPQNLRIGTFYFPLWDATVNGMPVSIEKDKNGVMLVPIGPEQSSVEINFMEPHYVRLANIVSIISFLAVISALLILGIAQMSNRHDNRPTN
ncbi:MAG: hypothetical protein ABIO36_02300, partial [Pyrinomonadaceae bacterium]